MSYPIAVIDIDDVSDTDSDVTTVVQTPPTIVLHPSDPPSPPTILLHPSDPPSPPTIVLHPSDPKVAVDALFNKLVCPICYRNFRRTESMQRHYVGTLVQANKVLQCDLSQIENEVETTERYLHTLRRRRRELIKKLEGNWLNGHRLHRMGMEDGHRMGMENGQQHAIGRDTKRQQRGETTDNPISLEACALPEYSVRHESEPKLPDSEETVDLRVGKCGHVYCSQCIESFVKQRKKCPICSQSLSVRTLYPLFL